MGAREIDAASRLQASSKSAAVCLLAFSKSFSSKSALEASRSALRLQRSSRWRVRTQEETLALQKAIGTGHDLQVVRMAQFVVRQQTLTDFTLSHELLHRLFDYIQRRNNPRSSLQADGGKVTTGRHGRRERRRRGQGDRRREDDDGDCRGGTKDSVREQTAWAAEAASA